MIGQTQDYYNHKIHSPTRFQAPSEIANGKAKLDQAVCHQVPELRTMPPKKKTRLSSRAASTLSTETPADTPSGPDDKVSPRKEDEAKQKENIADPWTDEQEISLFKGMIRWKPVGLFPIASGI